MDGHKAMVNNEVVDFNVKDLDFSALSSVKTSVKAAGTGADTEKSAPQGSGADSSASGAGGDSVIKSPLPGLF